MVATRRSGRNHLPGGVIGRLDAFTGGRSSLVASEFRWMKHHGAVILDVPDRTGWQVRQAPVEAVES